jgi:uncharacterized protein involved in exopolysaccharide biosynthesis
MQADIRQCEEQMKLLEDSDSEDEVEIEQQLEDARNEYAEKENEYAELKAQLKELKRNQKEEIKRLKKDLKAEKVKRPTTPTRSRPTTPIRAKQQSTPTRGAFFADQDDAVSAN